MADIIERLKFDAARCELSFSKGIAGNITEAAAEIARLRAALNANEQKMTHKPGCLATLGGMAHGPCDCGADPTDHY